MAGRPPLKPGRHGNITFTTMSTRKVQATAYVRDLDGVRREVSIIGTSRSDAREKLLEKIDDRMGVGTEVTADTMLDTIADLWISDIERRVKEGILAPNTARVYRSALKTHIRPGVGKLRVREATVSVLDHFVIQLRQNHQPDVVKTCRSALSGMMGYATRHGALSTNPVREVSRIYAGRKSKARAMTAAERDLWLAKMGADLVATRHDIPDLTTMLLVTGLRIAECLALSLSEIDPASSELVVNWQITRVTGDGLQRAPTKSAAGERTLHLPQFGLKVVRRRGDLAGWSGPLFPDARGGWRDPSNTSRCFREARERAGFGWVTSHVFRKTVATTLDSAGLSAREIADQLGHAKPSMTQDVYLGRGAVGPAAAAALDGGWSTASG
jgi:integrase